MYYIFQLLLFDFIIKFSFEQQNVYCDLNQNCEKCKICGKEKNNYCSCSFYNMYCKDEESNDYKVFSDFLYNYDGCITNNGNIEDICGKSNIDIDIGINKTITFQSSEYNNFFCFYNVKKAKNNNNDINIIIKKEVNEPIYFNMHLIMYYNVDNKVKTSTRINVLGSSNILEIIETDVEKISVYIDIPNGRNMDKISIFFGIGNKIVKRVSYKKNSNKIKDVLIYGILLGLFGIVIITLIICIIIYYRRAKRVRNNNNNPNNPYSNHIEGIPGSLSLEKSNKLKLNNLFKTILKPKPFNKINIINDCYNCTICLEDFKEGSSIIVTTKCKHSFHYNCFIKWVYKNILFPRCPNCNNPIFDEINPNNIITVPSSGSIPTFHNNDKNLTIGTETFGVSY